MYSRIELFGWPEPASADSGIARIVSAHGDYFHVVCNEAEREVIARKKKSAFLSPDAKKPITGDFVKIRYNPNGESFITDVLERYSVFERRDPTARRKSQVLAVNFDTLFIMMSMNANFSIPRLERYLALAEDLGRAEPVVILTKKDLTDNIPALPDLGGVRVIAMSSVTGVGIDEVRKIVQPRKTVAFIGSSGVGKSTLLNVLAGENWMATQEIQEWSGKGRHTTTSRELVMLPCGAMIIDTPGIREIGIVGEQEFELAKGASSHRWRG